MDMVAALDNIRVPGMFVGKLGVALGSVGCCMTDVPVQSPLSNLVQYPLFLVPGSVFSKQENAGGMSMACRRWVDGADVQPSQIRSMGFRL